MDISVNKNQAPLKEHLLGMAQFFNWQPDLGAYNHQVFEAMQYVISEDLVEVYVNGSSRMLKLHYDIQCGTSLFCVDFEGYHMGVDDKSVIITLSHSKDFKSPNTDVHDYFFSSGEFGRDEDENENEYEYEHEHDNEDAEEYIADIINTAKEFNDDKDEYKKHREDHFSAKEMFSYQDDPSDRDLAEANLYKLIVDLKVYNACAYNSQFTNSPANHLIDVVQNLGDVNLPGALKANLPGALEAYSTVLSSCKHLDNKIIKQIPELLMSVATQESQLCLVAAAELTKQVQEALSAANQINKAVSEMRSFARQ